MRSGGCLQMSIINDALKKAQDNFEKNKSRKKVSPDQTPPQSPQGKAEVDEKKKAPDKEAHIRNKMVNMYEKLYERDDVFYNKTSSPSPTVVAENQSAAVEKPIKKKSVGIVYVVFIAIAVVSAYLMSPLGQDNFSSLKKISLLQMSQIQSKPKPVYDEDTLILTGIMSVGETKAALINEEVYELGESINGKKIVNISIKEVELMDDDNQIITLKVRKK